MKEGIIIGVVLLLVVLAVVIWLLLGSKSYTVKFTGVEGYNNVEVKKGDTLTIPQKPTKSGYRFVGWYLDDKLFDFSSKITSDLTLEARFEAVGEVDDNNKFTVTFDSNGGSTVPSQSVAADGLVKKPSDPVREGYTFVEWQLNGKAYDFDSKVTKNFTLEAVWNKKSSSTVTPSDDTKKVTVTFDCNGSGRKKTTQTVESGKTVKQPADPVRDGYKFLGWFDNAAGSGKAFDFTKTKVTKDMTLYAKWQKLPSTTVKVESIDVKGTVNGMLTLKAGASINLEASIYPSNASNKNVKWEILSGKDSIISLDGNKLVALKAGTAKIKVTSVSDPNVWTEATVKVTPAESKNVPVTDVKLTSATSVTVGKTLTLKAEVSPADATNKTITWTLKNGTGEATLKDGVLTAVKAGTVTVVAHVDGKDYSFTITVSDSYTITYKTNGGSQVASETIKSGNKFTPKEATRKHYNFVGWYTDENCTHKFDYNSEVTSDVTVYAKWEAVYSYGYFEVEDDKVIQWEVKIYLGDTDVTNQFHYIWSKTGANLGAYDGKTGSMLVNKNKISEIYSITVDGKPVVLEKY